MNTSSLRRSAHLGLALALSVTAFGCASTARPAITTPEIPVLDENAVIFVEGHGLVSGNDLDCGPGAGSDEDSREHCTSAASEGALRAKPARGWRFDHWEIGGVSGRTQHIEVPPGGAVSYTAVFTPASTNVASAE